MKTIAECLGANIARRREQLGLSQAELAERIGLSQWSVGQIERGKMWLRKTTVASLARELETSEIELFQAPETIPEHDLGECARRLYNFHSGELSRADIEEARHKALAVLNHSDSEDQSESG